ncbi:MAG: alpha-L-fucosidase, partial [Rikenellaceae bacterium]
MKKQLYLFLTVIFCTTTSLSQDKLSGGGDLNPDLRVPYQAQQEFLDLRIGLSVHWGPSSLGGKEISWSRGDLIPKETYDAYYKDFNPVDFDAKQWCQLMERWGIKFIAPTAKHHDGFALWFSDYSDYDMQNAAYPIDIMEELRRECEKSGIVLGAYYSNLDWYHPDWTPYLYGGPGDLFPLYDDTPNMERYLLYMKNQVSELIEKYGVKFVQFDGEWDATYTHEIGSRLYRELHEVESDILLSSRIDIGRRSEGANNHLYMDGQKYAGDFMDRERLVNHGNNVTEWFDDAWQAWVTIDRTQWSYNPTPQLMTAHEMIEDMIGVIGNNGNYMINVAPTPSGTFVPEQIALMDTLGMWIHAHSEAIYGTRGGAYYPFDQGVSTRKGNKVWLFIIDNEVVDLQLPSLSQKILSATVFGTSTPVSYDDRGQVTTFVLPPGDGEQIRVVELSFGEEVRMSERRVLQNSFELGGAERIV